MLTIGFTNTYYTLWSVSKPYKHYFDKYSFVMKQDFTYHRNLSKNYEDAIAKVEAQEGSDYVVDLTMRGQKTYTREIGPKQSECPATLFPWGKCKWETIAISNNTWQLNRFYEAGLHNTAISVRRVAVNCRKRLVELGELIRIDWIEKQTLDVNWMKRDENGMFLREDYQDFEIKRKYANKSQYAIIQREQSLKKAQEESTHYFEDKQKVNLELKQIGEFGFDSRYGYTYIITYQDKDGRLFKYMGSSPLSVSKEEFQTVKATIKHSEYNGVKETHLQRMAIINSK